MNMKYQMLFIAILFNLIYFNVLANDEKPDEENQPNYEYIHIFKSIPALFEYLLNALEERPEILEKNDVTIFKRNVDIVDEENESTDEHKTDKREVGCDNKEGRFEENNKIDKRDAETTNVKENVKSYEFGNSNIVMKDYDDAPNVKRFAAKIHPKDIRASRDKVKIEKAKFNKFQNYRGKRSVLMKLSDDDEDVFLQKENTFYGFQNFFDLDLNPEDIEERILTAEKLLEEHNKLTKRLVRIKNKHNSFLNSKISTVTGRTEEKVFM